MRRLRVCWTVALWHCGLGGVKSLLQEERIDVAKELGCCVLEQNIFKRTRIFYRKSMRNYTCVDSRQANIVMLHAAKYRETKRDCETCKFIALTCMNQYAVRESKSVIRDGRSALCDCFKD